MLALPSVFLKHFSVNHLSISNVFLSTDQICSAWHSKAIWLFEIFRLILRLVAFKYDALQNWNNLWKCYRLRQTGPFHTI